MKDNSSRPQIKLLTTKEAAELLRISENALRIMKHRGKIRADTLGNRLRFKQSDLLGLLRSQED